MTDITANMLDAQPGMDYDAELKHHIYAVRGVQVMLDRDLAELYGVATKVLNQAVKRNADRFPEGFLFQLSQDELTGLRSQIVTS
ncbi:MAG: ORF6N domain-containing protein, partial [Victivallales bacterium]|nr:ORF6N domain-containing protein [Victivallales bacterium]